MKTMSLRMHLIASLLAMLLLAGCTQESEAPPVQVQVSIPPPETPEAVNLPELPALEHPGQVIFRSDSTGVGELSSNGEVLILRGPHSAPFSIELSQGKVEIAGEGQGKVVLASRMDNLLYFSRMWVTAIRSPSFAILPGAQKMVFLKPGEEVEYPVRVVSIGDFRQEVRLKAESSTRYVAAELSASGVPPFNATMRIRAIGPVGDGQYIKITGISPDERVESYVRINNPLKKREGGLLSAIFKILWIAMLPVTIAVSMALGFITGITAGAVGAVMLMNPVTFFSPQFLDAIAMGPSVGMTVTQEFLEQYSALSPFSGVAMSDGSFTGVSTIAVGNAFKVLLPRVELSPIVGQEMELPVYVAGHGEVVLNVTAPSAIEARVEPARGVAPFEAKLTLLAKREAQKRGLILKREKPYVVTINASSGKMHELYRIYLKPVRRDYDVRLSSDLVYIEQGVYAAVRALVVRNNQFSPAEYTLRVATPPGIRAFVEPESGNTPFVANVTLYAESLDMGRYTVSVGNAKLEVIAGRNGYAVVAPKGVSVAQGAASSIQVDVYTIKPVTHELSAEFPLNYSVVKLNDYSYRVDIVADKYTPPGAYGGRITYGEHSLPVSVTVTGVPVVVEHESMLRLGRGEKAVAVLNLVPAGYEGTLPLNFTATPGIEVSPGSVVANVPGRVEVEVINAEGIYGTVSFSGVVTYNGSRYGISGSIQVVP
jgi:hypothetical protein